MFCWETVFVSSLSYIAKSSLILQTSFLCLVISFSISSARSPSVSILGSLASPCDLSRRAASTCSSPTLHHRCFPAEHTHTKPWAPGAWELSLLPSLCFLAFKPIIYSRGRSCLTSSTALASPAWHCPRALRCLCCWWDPKRAGVKAATFQHLSWHSTFSCKPLPVAAPRGAQSPPPQQGKKPSVLPAACPGACTWGTASPLSIGTGHWQPEVIHAQHPRQELYLGQAWLLQ